MNIIPVIDLLNGVVVHAKKGQRDQYLPIESALTSAIKALDIVKAFLDIYPFNTVYIADLNAIQKKQNTYTTNYAVIASIKAQFPDLTIWLDAGIRNHAEMATWLPLHLRHILASESFSTLKQYLSLRETHQNSVLSLDYFAHGYTGPLALLNAVQHWPKDVIVMTLANVGTNQGANNALLNEIVAKAKGAHIYAAGGIRNINDLTMLKNMQIHGALVATAIHQKQITSNDIQLLMA